MTDGLRVVEHSGQAIGVEGAALDRRQRLGVHQLVAHRPHEPGPADLLLRRQGVQGPLAETQDLSHRPQHRRHPAPGDEHVGHGRDVPDRLGQDGGGDDVVSGLDDVAGEEPGLGPQGNQPQPVLVGDPSAERRQGAVAEGGGGLVVGALEGVAPCGQDRCAQLGRGDRGRGSQHVVGDLGGRALLGRGGGGASGRCLVGRRRPLMQPLAPRGRHAVVDRLTEHGMDEREPADRPGKPRDHAPAGGLLHQRPSLVRRPAGHLGDQADVELHSEHRRAPEQGPAVDAQVRQAPAHHLAHLDGQAQGLTGRLAVVGPSPSAVLHLKPSGLEQMAEELDDEERVALGDAVELVDQTDKGRVELVPGARRDEGPYPVPVETAKVDLVDEIDRSQLGDGVGEVMVRTDLVGPDRAHHQDPAGRQRPQEMPDQSDGRTVGPLHVVEDQHRGSVVATGSAEDGADGVEQAEPLQIGVPGRRGRSATELGQQPGQQGNLVRHGFGEGGHAHRGGVGSQRLTDRLIGADGIRRARAGQDHHPVVVPPLGELDRQPRLARARVPAHDDQPGRPGPDLVPRLFERRQLVVPGLERVAPARGDERRQRCHVRPRHRHRRPSGGVGFRNGPGQRRRGAVDGLGRTDLVGAEEVRHDPQHPFHERARVHAHPGQLARAGPGCR